MVKGAGKIRAVLGMALLAGLAACGGAEPTIESARPVLVVHPAAGADTAPAAYAGDIRARNESPLSFRVGGKLIKRSADLGDTVRQGQVLAELDPGDQRLQASAAQAQVAAADADLARARGDLQRYKALADQQLVSRSAYDAQLAAFKAAEGQARAARAQAAVAGNQASYTRLHAPRDGVIANRFAEAGQTVAAGQAIYMLAGDAGREVAIALPESHIRDVRVGQRVLVELWSAPGKPLPGRIREVSPAADPQTRTFAARVALEGDATKAVELGQSARVYMPQAGEGAALRVPLTAVQRSADGNPASLWVVDPASRRVRLAPVRLGAFAEATVPVLGGVDANAWIVAAGGHLLREGQLVAPVDRDNRPVLPPVAAPTAAR